MNSVHKIKQGIPIWVHNGKCKDFIYRQSYHYRRKEKIDSFIDDDQLLEENNSLKRKVREYENCIDELQKENKYLKKKLCSIANLQSKIAQKTFKY